MPSLATISLWSLFNYPFVWNVCLILCTPVALCWYLLSVIPMHSLVFWLYIYAPGFSDLIITVLKFTVNSLSYLAYCFLHNMVSGGESTVFWIIAPQYVIHYFSQAAFNIFFLVFQQFDFDKCLYMDFFEFALFWFFWASWICGFYVFCQMGTFLAIISSSIDLSTTNFLLSY